MDEIELRQLILRGEDSTLEFKSTASVEKPHDLAAECVAFLNKRGGVILLGVEDDGSMSGFTPEDINGCNSVLRSMAKDKISPSVMIDTTNVVTTLGIVIVLRLEEGIDKPYQTTRDGAFYIRSGDEKRHVQHRDELRRLFQVGSHVFAEKQPVKGSRLDQLDLKAYRDYYEERFQQDALRADDDLLYQMRGINLISGDCMTLAGCLLFGKNPQNEVPQFSVKSVWIKGLDLSASKYEDERHMEGTLPEMYGQAKAFLDAWNQRRQPEGESYSGKSKPLVDPIVFEEILTNAFVHRDYFIPDRIKIFIFDDRIEIYSPGTLPNSLTIEEATQGISRSRNPIIERIGLTLMNYRGHGTGLRRSKRLCPAIQFENSLSKNAFIVTIPF